MILALVRNISLSGTGHRAYAFNHQKIGKRLAD
jgi:hypothetical protein